MSVLVCFVFLMLRRPPRSTRTDTLFPYTTLFRSCARYLRRPGGARRRSVALLSANRSSVRNREREIWLAERRARRRRRRAHRFRGAACDPCGALMIDLHYSATRTVNWGTVAPRIPNCRLHSARSEERRVGQECVSTRRP